MRKIIRATGWALEGLSHGIRTERNVRIHLAVAAVTVAAGIWAALSVTEWLIVSLVIAVLISAELVNTAIESVVDLVSPDRHPLAKAAKDLAAAAVLVLSVAAIVIGCIIFLPRLTALF